MVSVVSLKKPKNPLSLYKRPSLGNNKITATATMMYVVLLWTWEIPAFSQSDESNQPWTTIAKKGI